MKRIRLSRVYYLNWKGIVLSADNPSVEATEENLSKLKEFINNGKLVVIDDEEDKKEQSENPPHIDKKIVAIPESVNVVVPTVIERIPLYTEEQLNEKSRAEVIEIANKNGLEFKKNISTAKLVELILEKQ